MADPAPRPGSPGDLPDVDDVARERVITDTEVYRGDLEALGAPIPDGEAVVDPSTDTGIRAGETDDPNVAAEEGLAWVPTIDPPVVGNQPDGDPRIVAGFQPDGDPRIVAGFGVDAQAEPWDADHASSALEDDVVAIVRDALRADARTSGVADTLDIRHSAGIVVIDGLVEDLDDEDDVVEVAEGVADVVEVVSRLRVRALGD